MNIYPPVSDGVSAELMKLLPAEVQTWDAEAEEIVVKDMQIRELKSRLALCARNEYVTLDACYRQRDGETLDVVLAAWREETTQGKRNVFGLIFEVPRNCTPKKSSTPPDMWAQEDDVLWFKQHKGKLIRIRKKRRGEVLGSKETPSTRWLIVLRHEKQALRLPWSGRQRPSEQEADELRRLFAIGGV